MFSTCLLPLYFKHKNKLHNTNFREKKKKKVIIYLGFTCQFALPLITSVCLIKSTMPHYHAVERPVPAVFFLTMWTCGQEHSRHNLSWILHLWQRPSDSWCTEGVTRAITLCPREQWPQTGLGHGHGV